MGLGDLPFLPIENVTAVVHDKLLNADFARQLSAANIDPSRTYPWKYYFQEPNPFENSKDSGTTHFTVIDKDRNTVAMTTTVNTLFGSQVVSAATGVMYVSS
jgi:gamma-glutamyltranspeptidase